MIRRFRTALIAGLVVVLTLSGGGIAAAYWTAQAQLQATAKTATTGMAQTASATSLAITYNASTLRAAGTVTVQNTGNRAATYALTLASTSATVPGLLGAIAVRSAPVANVAACAATATLTSPQTGTASSFTATGTLAAGASVVLCVQTSMTAADVTTYAGATTSLSMRSSLEWAASAAWRTSGAAVVFAQGVASAQFVPAGAVMTCGGDQPWYLDMTFPPNTGHEGSTVYRVFFAKQATPTARVAYPLVGEEAPKGWYSHVQLSWQDARIASYLSNPAGGSGNTWVFVEQSVSGGAWAAAAYAQIRIFTDSGAPRVACGWQ